MNDKIGWITGFLLCVMLLDAASSLGGDEQVRENGIAPADFGENATSLWSPTLEWTLKNDSCEGNPFDLVAKATFTHESGKETRVSEMFYAGENNWNFRFTATRTGRWTFTTQANGKDGTTDAPDLHGREGTITVQPKRGARGFLTHEGQTWCWQGSGRPFVPQLVMIGGSSDTDPRQYRDAAFVDRLI